MNLRLKIDPIKATFTTSTFPTPTHLEKIANTA